MSLERWALKLMEGRQVLVANYLFESRAIIKYDVYTKHIHRTELDGKLCPVLVPAVRALVGPNSVIMLPGGKGHSRHKRLRGKLLASLGPNYVLSILPEIKGLIHKTLDDMVEQTKNRGFGVFEAAAGLLAFQSSVLPVLAGLPAAKQRCVQDLLDEILGGMFAVPLNLGRFSAHGRAVLARKKMCDMTAEIMASPNLSQQNIIADLMQETVDGKGFSKEEVLDTVLTLLLAGKLTTADALPSLLVDLHQHRSWVDKIAAEPLEMQGVETDSATLRFVRESLRMKPPTGAYLRANYGEDTDLGEHGVVPKGMCMALYFSADLTTMGKDFNPDRWTPELVRSHFLVFGGHQPHECVGKHLALMELQLFAKVLCKEYEFEVLDTTEVVNPSNPMTMCYKGGCQVKVRRK
ncbi:unnamed protein product [Effrenium voratum]|uniref:Cytochrome P450 n=1 Tax=Effrenium voratum TaxID=2562239 RepID=A0AA36MYW5_9DINO|nr:unnamed protein product [Effrenium voratum]CAJ1413839.1 unnamed protein product [Effrenium voratum]